MVVRWWTFLQSFFRDFHEPGSGEMNYASPIQRAGRRLLNYCVLRLKFKLANMFECSPCLQTSTSVQLVFLPRSRQLRDTSPLFFALTVWLIIHVETWRTRQKAYLVRCRVCAVQWHPPCAEFVGRKTCQGTTLSSWICHSVSASLKFGSQPVLLSWRTMSPARCGVVVLLFFFFFRGGSLRLWHASSHMRLHAHVIHVYTCSSDCVTRLLVDDFSGLFRCTSVERFVWAIPWRTCSKGCATDAGNRWGSQHTVAPCLDVAPSHMQELSWKLDMLSNRKTMWVDCVSDRPLRLVDGDAEGRRVNLLLLVGWRHAGGALGIGHVDRVIVRCDTRSRMDRRHCRMWRVRWIEETPVLRMTGDRRRQIVATDQKLTETKKRSASVFFLAQRVWGETLFQWTLLLFEMLFRNQSMLPTRSHPDMMKSREQFTGQSLRWIQLNITNSSMVSCTRRRSALSILGASSRWASLVRTSSSCSSDPVESWRLFRLDSMHSLMILCPRRRFRPCGSLTSCPSSR